MQLLCFGPIDEPCAFAHATLNEYKLSKFRVYEKKSTSLARDSISPSILDFHHHFFCAITANATPHAPSTLLAYYQKWLSSIVVLTTYCDKMASSTNLAEARRTANLRVLQRLDPQIVDLAITASHVVLYQFSLQTQQWIKCNIEGSLFVTKRSDVPRFKLIISNRNSTENLEVGITSTFQMQLREPYLIFRDSAAAAAAAADAAIDSAPDEAIRGLWFHDGKEREQVHSYLENVVKSLQKIEEMEREHGPPPSLMNHDQNNDDADSNNDNVTTRGPVEVNTNAAGAALLSTLHLNDNKNTAPTTTTSQSTTAQPTRTTQSTNTTNSSTSSSSSSSQLPNTLDKKSLQLALLSLIQDERFLDLIHAQYLKVASSRAQREQQQQQQNGTSIQGDTK